MWTLFVIITTFIPADKSINGEEHWGHSHSVNLGEFTTHDDCRRAMERQEVLLYPGYPKETYKCVKGWQKREAVL